MAAFVIRAFQLSGNEAIAISTIAAMGYLSGVLIRASAALRLAVPHILAKFVLLIVARLVASDERYWPIGFLLTCFCVGCIDLSRIMHTHIAAQFLAEHRLHLAARIDCLTGPSNRIALDEALGERRAMVDSAIVAMIDLDGFKTVNDSHGHAVGDRLLKAVGKGMRMVITEQHIHRTAWQRRIRRAFRGQAHPADAEHSYFRRRKKELAEISRLVRAGDLSTESMQAVAEAMGRIPR